MTREEAIQCIRHELLINVNRKDLTGQAVGEALDMAIEALSAEPKWIPVSERLPDIEQDVLATTTLFGIREVTFAWRINDGEWLIREGSSEATNNDILAWMPLPKPYREESEVEE